MVVTNEFMKLGGVEDLREDACLSAGGALNWDVDFKWPGDVDPLRLLAFEVIDVFRHEGPPFLCVGDSAWVASRLESCFAGQSNGEAHLPLWSAAE